MQDICVQRGSGLVSYKDMALIQQANFTAGGRDADPIVVVDRQERFPTMVARIKSG